MVLGSGESAAIRARRFRLQCARLVCRLADAVAVIIPKEPCGDALQGGFDGRRAPPEWWRSSAQRHGLLTPAQYRAGDVYCLAATVIEFVTAKSFDGSSKTTVAESLARVAHAYEADDFDHSGIVECLGRMLRPVETRPTALALLTTSAWLRREMTSDELREVDSQPEVKTMRGLREMRNASVAKLAIDKAAAHGAPLDRAAAAAASPNLPIALAQSLRHCPSPSPLRPPLYQAWWSVWGKFGSKTIDRWEGRRRARDDADTAERERQRHASGHGIQRFGHLARRRNVRAASFELADADDTQT